jgi:DNA-directed RNA polymerase subunit A'
MDFDGDEVNVHVVQSEEAEAELLKYSHTRNTIISPANGDLFCNLVQDTTLSLYMMTKKISKVDVDLISSEDIEYISKLRNRLGIIPQTPNNHHDSFALLSSCLPRNLFMEDDNFQIICGIWTSGYCNKEATKKLIKYVYHEFGNDIASDMMTKLQHTAVKWISRVGFTINGDDVKNIDVNFVNNFTFEKVMSQEENGMDIRNELHKIALENNPNCNILDCVKSGAKGTSLNIGQIKACLGQQECKSGIIESTLSGNRVMPHDRCNKVLNSFEKMIKHGYIINSYSTGLNYRELFLHAIPSRDSIIDTATGTAVSGYAEHRIVKRLDDVIIDKEGRVVYMSSKPKTLALTFNNNINVFLPNGIEKNLKNKKQLSLYNK